MIAAVVLALLAPAGGTASRGDSVTLKNGTVYRGTVDKDDTVVSVFDGLRRILLHDTRIARTQSDPANRGGADHFALIQPIEKHTGEMPSAAFGVHAEPWDRDGRRVFSYLAPRSRKPVRMTQALIDLGPTISKLRGIDGFWQGQVATSQIPRPIVIGLIKRGDVETNVNERFKFCRFLIQAEWYDEARAELDRLARDFPESRETARKGKADVLTAVRDQLARLKAQESDDRAAADALQGAADALDAEDRKALRPALGEILGDLTEAPDAARPRLEAFTKALADPAVGPAARFALALSGWALGPDAAVADLPTAQSYWIARGAVLAYLQGRTEEDRAGALETLRILELPGPRHQTLDMETVTRLVRNLPPPLREEQDSPGQARVLRVLDDPNAEPTEYTVLLPPEYHHARTYPAVVALHNGTGMPSAIDWWGAEAARRGYIVIAPEYNLRTPPDYRYTPSEHASAELSLRDALKRFSIDPDRVILGGHGLGGDMAWDFGLGHPDLFAGVATISGLPAKYAWAYKGNARRLPLYVALGDLSGAGELVLNMAKDLITRNYDVTYVEYYRRGRDNLPEEAPSVFDWMASLRRDPAPKKFDVVSARECDRRFYGVVIQEFAPGRDLAPEAVEVQGKNLRPATIKVTSSNLSNLLRVATGGLQRFDVWVSPKVLDFKRKIEVRVNNDKKVFSGLVKPDFGPFLEDLRLRGDRQQVYWLKVPVKL